MYGTTLRRYPALCISSIRQLSEPDFLYYRRRTWAHFFKGEQLCSDYHKYPGLLYSHVIYIPGGETEGKEILKIPKPLEE